MSKHNCKVCFVGSGGVGKSSLVARFVTNTFIKDHQATIGAAFTSKHILNTNVQLNLWDTAGQERYRSLASIYYRDSLIIVGVISITLDNLMKRLKSLVLEIIKKCTALKHFIFVINKTDLIARSELHSLVKKLTVELNEFMQKHELTFTYGIHAFSVKIPDEKYYDFEKELHEKAIEYALPKKFSSLKIDLKNKNEKCCIIM